MLLVWGRVLQVMDWMWLAVQRDVTLEAQLLTQGLTFC